MKKVMAIVLAGVLLCASLCGCGSKADPVGEYSNESFISSLASILSITLPTRVHFTVTENADGYAFEEKVPIFEGSAQVKGGMLVCTREDGSGLGNGLEDGVYAKEVSYFMHEDYLVSEETNTELYQGELPAGAPSECIVSNSVSRHVVAFTENGNCEIKGYHFLDDDEMYSALGSYTVDGSMLNVTITKYTSPEGETETGEYNFCMFVKDGKIYDTVYKKIVEEGEQQ